MRARCLLPETKSSSKKTPHLINSSVDWSLDRPEMRKVPLHTAVKINLFNKLRVISQHRIMFHKKVMGDGLKRNTQSSLRVSKSLARIGSRSKIISVHDLVRRRGPTRRSFSESFKERRNSRSCWSLTSYLWKRRRETRDRRINRQGTLPHRFCYRKRKR